MGASRDAGPETQRTLWYYGVTGNFAALKRFRWEVIRAWRNGWRAGAIHGDVVGTDESAPSFFYLPEARIVHSIYAAKRDLRNRMPKLCSYGSVGCRRVTAGTTGNTEGRKDVDASGLLILKV